MLKDSSYLRPLYDTLDGGPPSAWRCLKKNCGKVTRTWEGMMMHMKRMHKFKPQMEMDFFENRGEKEENAVPENTCCGVDDGFPADGASESRADAVLEPSPVRGIQEPTRMNSGDDQ